MKCRAFELRYNRNMVIKNSRKFATSMKEKNWNAHEWEGKKTMSLIPESHRTHPNTKLEKRWRKPPTVTEYDSLIAWNPMAKWVVNACGVRLFFPSVCDILFQNLQFGEFVFLHLIHDVRETGVFARGANMNENQDLLKFYRFTRVPDSFLSTNIFLTSKYLSFLLSKRIYSLMFHS